MFSNCAPIAAPAAPCGSKLAEVDTLLVGTCARAAYELGAGALPAESHGVLWDNNIESSVGRDAEMSETILLAIAAVESDGVVRACGIEQSSVVVVLTITTWHNSGGPVGGGGEIAADRSLPMGSF